MAGNIIGDGRLFEPSQVKGLERFGGSDRFFDRPLHISVGHQRKALTEMIAHGPYTGYIGCQILAADLHLDGTKTFAEVVIRLLQQIFDGEIEIDATGVTGYVPIESAQ